MKDPRDSQTLDLVDAARRPLTGAERQRRRREKLKKLKQTEGLQALMLTAGERSTLRLALDLLNEYQQPQGDKAAYQFELLQKLAPGATWRPEQARALACLKWNAEAGVAHAEEEQRRAEREAREWKRRAEAAEQALRALGAVQVAGEWQGVDQLPEDMAQTLATHGPVVAMLEVVHRIREVGRVANQDMARALELRRQVERLESEQQLLEKERCAAMAAARVFEQRLRDAGLSTDYRG